MREPTREEMIEGIAKGVEDFLLQMSAGKYGNDRPLQILKLAAENAIADFASDSHDAIVDAISRRGGQSN